ncbi:class I adenylate-forming enzyme family protein [Streptomyces sp. NPDC055078]
MDFVTILDKGQLMYRDCVAVTSEGRHQTYGELVSRARRLAHALAGLGLSPGDRVAVLADNRLEAVEQAAGIALAGMVRCPLYALNPASTHAFMLENVGASVCIVQDSYADGIEAVRDLLPALKHIVVVHEDAETGRPTTRPGDLGRPDHPGHVDRPDHHDYEELLASASPEPPGVSVPMEADHIIRFSAGTTGRPKGIVHTGAAWLAMGIENMLSRVTFEESDSYLVASPMSHAAGLNLWPVLANGGRYVIMRKFDPVELLRVIERERCTITLLVPTMIQMVVSVPDAERYDLSSLRAVFYGAAPISERTLRAAMGLWGNIMYQAYGQSEALPATVLTPRHHRTGGSERERHILTSAGRATVNTAITIRDESDHVLPVGRTGEICLRTPGAMRGIWGDPVATAERFTPDGAVRTRDMGYLDEEGFLHIVDRKEDMIISGGFNIWPLEVENALAAHPGVQEVAVVGVPDDKWGESVFAVVVLNDGATADEDELIAWARERVGPVKKPRHLLISREPLPKSVVGKLLRRKVREQFWPGAQEAVNGS